LDGVGTWKIANLGVIKYIPEAFSVLHVVELGYFTIDYGCEDGRFLVSESCVTISTAVSFPAVKPWLILE
jgi:hypothetical protein